MMNMMRQIIAYTLTYHVTTALNGLLRLHDENKVFLLYSVIMLLGEYSKLKDKKWVEIAQSV
jgi:hypothetical protein